MRALLNARLLSALAGAWLIACQRNPQAAPQRVAASPAQIPRSTSSLLTLLAFQEARAAGYRVVAFDLDVRGARVVGIQNIPADWSVELDCSTPPWPVVRGSTHHGAGALASVSELSGLLTLLPEPETGVPPSVSADLTLTKDFQSNTVVHIKALPLGPAPGGG